MKKICKKCELEKNLDEMIKSKTSKGGYASLCKDCNRLKSKKYRENNKDYYDKYIKEYYNRVEIKEKIRLHSIKYREDNKDKLKSQKEEWRKKNKDKVKEQKKRWNKLEKENNLLYYLSQLISASFRKSFRRNGFSKKSKSIDILGCTFDEFKLYLESKFEEWMGWENKGLYNGEFNYGWDIDHIIPISSANTEEEIIKLNHYTNLQPLCSKVNRDIKKNKYYFSNK
jgi:hypothetical protein